MHDSIIQNSTFNTQHYIDWHSHILPGLDDGAVDLDEALAIARILAEAGFGRVHCTPHSIPGSYEATPATVRRAMDELSEALEREGISLQVAAGNEYYCDEFLPSRLDDPLPLGDSGMVLMEAPLQATPELLSHTAFQVRRRGFTPLIAHPERCALLAPKRKRQVRRSLLDSMLDFARAKLGTQRGSHNLEPGTLNVEHDLGSLLRSMGCRFQGNIGSFAGLYGERVRHRALRHLREGLYDCLGSDAHSSRGLDDWLPRGLDAVRETVGEEGLAALLAGPARADQPKKAASQPRHAKGTRTHRA